MTRMLMEEILKSNKIFVTLTSPNKLYKEAIDMANVYGPFKADKIYNEDYLIIDFNEEQFDALKNLDFLFQKYFRNKFSVPIKFVVWALTNYENFYDEISIQTEI